MKVITSFKAPNYFGNEEKDGVRLTPAETGDHLRLVVNEKSYPILARMSNVAFEEAVRRGDALTEPLITLKHHFGRKEARHISHIGGLQVKNCAVELKEDGMWLVPETTESNAVLLFLEVDEWMTHGRKITVEGGKILANIEDKSLRRHWSAIAMEPGSSVRIATYDLRRVEGSGPDVLHWFRKERWEPTIVGEKLLTLSADGKELML